MSLATYLVIWAMSITGTGVFLAIGFELGKWIVTKVRKWCSFHKGIKSDEVQQFINEMMTTETVK